MMDRAPTKKLSPLNKVDAGLIVENHDSSLNAVINEGGQKNSKFLSLGVAVLLHVILFIILALIVLVNFEDQQIEMLVEAGAQNSTQQIEKK